MTCSLRSSLILSAATAAMAFGGLTGCVVREEPAPTVVYSNAPPPAPAPAPDDPVAPQAPPPEIVETQPPPPDPTFVWVGGYWWWDGYHYAWRRGYWHRPAPGFHVWVRPGWRYGPHGYVFVRGYWR
jgi:hypothetical protein